MSRWDAGDVGVDRDVAILVTAEQQEIADRDLVQVVAHLGMQAHGGKAVAAGEQSTSISVVERFDAQRVHRADELAAGRVPEREAEVAEQARQAVLTPD